VAESHGNFTGFRVVVPVPDRQAPALLRAPFTKEQADLARAEWSAFLHIAERKQLPLPKGAKLELVLIPPGKFRMGTEGNMATEAPHEVTIEKPFYLAVTETTQEQYQAVTGENPSYFQAEGSGKDKLGAITDTSKFPVDTVNWYEAEAFCRQIKAELPTEAQWEFACRAGTTTEYHFGTSLNGDEANCKGTDPFGTAILGPFLQRTTAAGSYKPNAFGLFDMHGNVYEWCQDQTTKAEHVEATGPKPPAKPAKDAKDYRILRSGAWDRPPKMCRSAYRGYNMPGFHANFNGFRVVVPLQIPPPPPS
jgi:formylglycine-generating enzyme required for sulfatase activity